MNSTAYFLNSSQANKRAFLIIAYFTSKLPRSACCLQDGISFVRIWTVILTLLLQWQWKYSIIEDLPNLRRGENLSPPPPNQSVDNIVIMPLCLSDVPIAQIISDHKRAWVNCFTVTHRPADSICACVSRDRLGAGSFSLNPSVYINPLIAHSP